MKLTRQKKKELNHGKDLGPQAAGWIQPALWFNLPLKFPALGAYEISIWFASWSRAFFLVHQEPAGYQ